MLAARAYPNPTQPCRRVSTRSRARRTHTASHTCSIVARERRVDAFLEDAPVRTALLSRVAAHHKEAHTLDTAVLNGSAHKVFALKKKMTRTGRRYIRLNREIKKIIVPARRTITTPGEERVVRRPRTGGRSSPVEVEGIVPVFVPESDLCHYCNTPMTRIVSTAVLGCMTCCRVQPYLEVTPANVPFGEEVEFSNFAYKRKAHLLEWFKYIQALEKQVPDDEVVNKVMDYLYYNMNIRNTDNIQPKHVRIALEELEMRTYYPNKVQIWVRITGKSVPRFSMFQQRQLLSMFDACQAPFEKHKPDGRKNFLSYSYFIYKLCELMGYDEFLPLVDLPKGEDKLRKQDALFKKICGELQWKFIRSSRS